MNRIAQFAVLGAAVLFAAQPVFAGLPCAFGQPSGCGRDCPMAMSSMGADCPMAGSMTAGDCPQDCCALGHAQAAAPPIAVEKLSAAAATPAPARIAPTADPAAFLRAVAVRRTESPPLYLLHQVFRI